MSKNRAQPEKPTSPNFAMINLLMGGLVRAYELGADWEHEATHDSLTGVLNRAGLAQEYLRGLDQHQRSLGDKPDLLFVIDLDNFKSTNDTKGHKAGDRTLKEMASIISGSVRETDVVGRTGGDEFVAFLYGATIEEGAEIAESMRLSAEMFHGKQDWLDIKTLSIGVGAIDYSLGFEDVIETADEAMYIAKQAGKNQVHILE